MVLAALAIAAVGLGVIPGSRLPSFFQGFLLTQHLLFNKNLTFAALLHCCTVPNVARRTSREDSRFKFLMEGYQSSFGWWEAVVLSRKFLPSCVRILVQSPVVQGQMGVAILFMCSMAQAR